MASKLSRRKLLTGIALTAGSLARPWARLPVCW